MKKIEKEIYTTTENIELLLAVQKTISWRSVFSVPINEESFNTPHLVDKPQNVVADISESAY